MNEKLNCWEYNKCSREPGGSNVDKLGICSTATSSLVNGINGGTNGGRICWLIAGTYGKYKAEYADCTSAQKMSSCFDCEFHRKVLEEEGFISGNSRIGNLTKKKIRNYSL